MQNFSAMYLTMTGRSILAPGIIPSCRRSFWIGLHHLLSVLMLTPAFEASCCLYIAFIFGQNNRQTYIIRQKNIRTYYRQQIKRTKKWTFERCGVIYWEWTYCGDMEVTKVTIMGKVSYRKRFKWHFNRFYRDTMEILSPSPPEQRLTAACNRLGIKILEW